MVDHHRSSVIASPWLCRALEREESKHSELYLDFEIDPEIGNWRSQIRRIFRSIAQCDGSSNEHVVAVAECYMDLHIIKALKQWRKVGPIMPPCEFFQMLLSGSVPSIHLAMKAVGNRQSIVGIERILEFMPQAAIGKKEVIELELEMIRSLKCDMIISTLSEFIEEYLKILSHISLEDEEKYGRNISLRSPKEPALDIILIRMNSNVFAGHIQDSVTYIGMKASVKATVAVHCGITAYFENAARYPLDSKEREPVEERVRWIEQGHRTNDMFLEALRSLGVDVNRCEYIAAAVAGKMDNDCLQGGSFNIRKRVQNSSLSRPTEKRRRQSF